MSKRIVRALIVGDFNPVNLGVVSNDLKFRDVKQQEHVNCISEAENRLHRFKFIVMPLELAPVVFSHQLFPKISEDCHLIVVGEESALKATPTIHPRERRMFVQCELQALLGQAP